MPATRWTVVVPVYNERDFLPRTLLSLADQAVPATIIVVDNGSTDDSVERAKAIASERGLDALFLHERCPGQVHALKRGIDTAESEFVAVCDADTWYPPHYLMQAERLFDTHGETCVAVASCDLPDSGGWGARFVAWHKLAAAWLMPRQNHTSGAGHCFRLAVLKAAGGYDAEIWPYVLKDHELIQRVLQHGSQKYHRDMWCLSSRRRRDRSAVRWTVFERLLYHTTPFRWRTGLFHQFLAPRFAARGLKDTALRLRPWEHEPQASA